MGCCFGNNTIKSDDIQNILNKKINDITIQNDDNNNNNNNEIYTNYNN